MSKDVVACNKHKICSHGVISVASRGKRRTPRIKTPDAREDMILGMMSLASW